MFSGEIDIFASESQFFAQTATKPCRPLTGWAIISKKTDRSLISTVAIGIDRGGCGVSIIPSSTKFLMYPNRIRDRRARPHFLVGRYTQVECETAATIAPPL